MFDSGCAPMISSEIIVASMAVQDDRRENEMRKLFQLAKDDAEGRSGTDATLVIDGHTIPFELKSSTEDSVTTVRDFSMDHVIKWRNKHWLFGFYEKDGISLKYCLYGSPEMMRPWISMMEAYIAPDLALATLLPKRLTLEDMFHVCGKKEKYSLEDVMRIQKKQYRKTEYLSKRDLPDGYSPLKMLEILQDRARYLVQRGSTLNNPHIPGRFFKDWQKITTNHADELRRRVRETLHSAANADATPQAT